jgi:hypothetical protein
MLLRLQESEDTRSTANETVLPLNTEKELEPRRNRRRLSVSPRNTKTLESDSYLGDDGEYNDGAAKNEINGRFFSSSSSPSQIKSHPSLSSKMVLLLTLAPQPLLIFIVFFTARKMFKTDILNKLLGYFDKI